MLNISSDKKPLVIIFMTVFIYLLGFGIIIPIIPILGTQMGATAFQTGLLISVYSLMQFLFSPFWGRLSDKYGRRPILLICLIGEVFAYLLFARAKTLEWLFVARIFSGFFGASISTASAYISDITPPHERSKGMALIGAAFGLGFLFGPAIGGGLTVWAEHLSTDIYFRTSFSSYFVSLICLITSVFAWKYLKETLDPARVRPPRMNRFHEIVKYFRIPTVGPLIFVFFLSSLAMSTMEATLILFTKAKFDWGIKEVSFGFAYIGIIMIFTQGYLVRKLIPKLGEKQVLRTGLVLMTMGLSGIAIAQSIGVLALTQTLLAVGIGFVNPSILGSISLLTDPNEQGASLGTTQGMASLGRIIGPVAGGALFGALTIESPFILSGAMTMIALFVVITIFKEIPNAGLKTKKSPLLNKIGFYQLDNLINNRVPFLFFNMSESILGWYSSVNKMHLESYEILTTESEIIALLTEKKAPKDYAIVLLCPDGRISLKLNTELEKLGYTNVYVIDGGYAQLVTERE